MVLVFVEKLKPPIPVPGFREKRKLPESVVANEAKDNPDTVESGRMNELLPKKELSCAFIAALNGAGLNDTFPKVFSPFVEAGLAADKRLTDLKATLSPSLTDEVVEEPPDLEK